MDLRMRRLIGKALTDENEENSFRRDNMTDREKKVAIKRLMGKYCKSINGKCDNCIFEWKPTDSERNLCQIIIIESEAWGYCG